MDKETYKNFTITVFWFHNEYGYRFRIHNANGTLVSEGCDTYFYDYSALRAAKKVIDEMEVSA